jgi:hypothetical protein
VRRRVAQVAQRPQLDVKWVVFCATPEREREARASAAAFLDAVARSDVVVKHCFSSYSESWLDHARRFADMAVDRFRLSKASTVVEIGSNDGSCCSSSWRRDSGPWHRPRRQRVLLVPHDRAHLRRARLTVYDVEELPSHGGAHASSCRSCR